jgi:flagellar basal-body rod protein FlgF
MADGMYVSMNGAAARLEQLESISDNLANVQTPGFKASRPAFEAFLAADAPRHGGDKTYPAAVQTQFDLRPGTVVTTNEPMDVLPDGQAFLAVDGPGGPAYTRNGKLTVDFSDNTLRAGGLKLVDRTTQQAITVPPGATVRLDDHGTVWADQTRVGELTMVELHGPIDRLAPTLLRPQNPDDATLVADPKLHLGAIETGNSSPLEAAVQMVAAQRNFEAALQALQTSKKLDDRAIEVGRMK